MFLWCKAINSAALLWGGVSDFKRREIPNLVPALLLFTGVLTGSFLVQRIAVMLCVAAVLVLAEKLAKGKIPGGDFKLICALTFSEGVPVMLGTLALSGIGSVLWGLCQHEPLSRNVPLCSYVAPAYLILNTYLLIVLILR